jgi:lupus La protein
VEFYFSDANLARDKFLFTQIGGRKNLPVPIATIHSFKRMRRFQPVSTVVEALKSSSTLDIVEDDTAIRRKKPFEADADTDQFALQRQFDDESLARSIHAKGFGEEKPTTQFDIEAFFAKHGPTNQVRLRRFTDKTFRGSVFVEFDSEDTAKQFLEAKPAPSYNGNTLTVLSKKEWLKQEAAKNKDRPPKDRNAKDRSLKDRNERSSYRPPKDDGRDWRVRREEDRKAGYPERRSDEGKRESGPRDRNEEKKQKEEGEKQDAEEKNDGDKGEKRAREDDPTEEDQPAKRAKEDEEA